MLSDTINARVGCDFEDVSVALQAGDENRIDVLFRWPDLPDDEQTAMHAAIVAVETIFGEENLDKWVGVIEPLSAEQADQSGLKFLSSDRAAETFEALRMSMIEQLPEIPWAHDDENDKWALMQREAVQADDYAAQDDVITCVTCNPDVIATAFSSRVFTSERFGRNREIFAYVKIDGNAQATWPTATAKKSKQQSASRSKTNASAVSLAEVRACDTSTLSSAQRT